MKGILTFHKILYQSKKKKKSVQAGAQEGAEEYAWARVWEGLACDLRSQAVSYLTGSAWSSLIGPSI